MTLGDKQRLLGELLVMLLTRMLGAGFQFRIAFAKRCEECPVGRPRSNHKSMLAIDIDLFDEDGNYLSKTEDHEEFGKFWEGLHSLCRWGGRWDAGNHYSIEHKGMK